MNTSRTEQLLLLEQSGELSPTQRRDIDAELAASPEARRFREQLRALSAAAPQPAAQPAPDAAARIAARLRQQQTPVWKPLLAAAAALALFLGVRAFSPQAPVPADSPAVAEAEEWDDPLDAEFTELESLLFAISSDDSLEITEL